MSVTVASNRFIVPSIVKYRQFLGGISNVSELGKHLTLTAETAQRLRQTDILRECGLILSNFPVREYQLIGQYYLGWLEYWNGNLVSPTLFENIFEESKTYKAKALMTLAALSAAKGHLEDEMRYEIEALKYSDIPNSIKVLRGIAVVKAKEGFHKSASRDLEALVPFLRYTQAPVSYEILNSLAVELGEVGRIAEAQNVCRIVLASPYTFAYPEWRETEQEIALLGYKSHSLVSVIKPVVENVIPLPVAESNSIPIQGKPARIVSYARFKKKMVKKANGENDSDKLPEDMSSQDMAMKILELITENKGDEEKLRKLMESAIKIFSEKK